MFFFLYFKAFKSGLQAYGCREFKMSTSSYIHLLLGLISKFVSDYSYFNLMRLRWWTWLTLTLTWPRPPTSPSSSMSPSHPSPSAPSSSPPPSTGQKGCSVWVQLRGEGVSSSILGTTSLGLARPTDKQTASCTKDLEKSLKSKCLTRT